jgi:predicted Zn-dependent protease
VAISFYKEALQEDSTFTDRTGIAPALRLLDQAIRIRPADAYYWSSRGDVLRKAGRRSEAVQNYRKALSLLPAEDAAARAEIEAALAGVSRALPLPPSPPGE